jgi:hypothetical protein
MATRFKHKLVSKNWLSKNEIHAQFVPDNEYENMLKVCETVSSITFDDPDFTESMRTRLFNDLSEIYGTEFTDDYFL